MAPNAKGMPLVAAEEQSSTRTTSPVQQSPPEKPLPALELDPAVDTTVYLTGWRLQVLSFSLSLCMVLVNIEVAIIGTSLISITNDLHGFSQMGWVVTGYLITYTGMIIIWSKFSDVFGRKPAILATLSIFTLFSGACGATQTMTQLIICRVFQGIGAAGCFSLALVIAYEMVPKEKYPAQAAQLAASTALGSLVGPLIGGAISQDTTWRWVFLLNVPAGVLTVILLFISIPKNFPHHGKASYVAPTLRQKFSSASLARLDVFGTVFLLGATLLLVTVLLEAGTSFSWNSGTSISLLVVSAVLWALFVINERFVSSEKRRPEPIFPWRFFFSRAWMGTLLISLFSGIPYNTIVITIPQRFQAVYGTSPLGAGIRLIPFNFLISFASVFVNIIAAKARIKPIYLLLIGSALQLIGLALFTTLSDDTTIPAAIYGFEIISGFGVGMVIGICLVIPPHVVETRDLAVASGALLQFRIFGGALGLAIASNVLNNHLRSSLAGLISAEDLAKLLQSTALIRLLPAELQAQVLAAFSDGYNLQMKIMAGFAGAQLLTVGMLWRKNQISVVSENALPEEETANLGEEKVSEDSRPPRL